MTRGSSDAALHRDSHIFTIKGQFQKLTNTALTQISNEDLGSRSLQGGTRELVGQVQTGLRQQGWSVHQDRLSEMNVLS